EKGQAERAESSRYSAAQARKQPLDVRRVTGAQRLGVGKEYGGTRRKKPKENRVWQAVRGRSPPAHGARAQLLETLFPAPYIYRDPGRDRKPPQPGKRLAEPEHVEPTGAI